MSTTEATIDAELDQNAAPRPQRRAGRLVLLAVGAFAFVFPFYYMFIGSLQKDPDTGIGGAYRGLAISRAPTTATSTTPSTWSGR